MSTIVTEPAANALIVVDELGQATLVRHRTPRIVAFEAQQCAEKALKAALLLDGIEPRRTSILDEPDDVADGDGE